MSAVGGATTFPEPTVVVVGSCNVDLTSYLPQVPGPGETVIGRSFSIGFGARARIKRSWPDTSAPAWLWWGASVGIRSAT